MELHALTQFEGHGLLVCGHSPALSEQRADFAIRGELDQGLAGVEVDIHALRIGVATGEHCLIKLPGQYELAAILRLWLLRRSRHHKHRTQRDRRRAY